MIDESPSTSNRDEMLDMLVESAREIRSHLDDRELCEPEDEHLQIKWYRALAQVAGQYRKLEKDTQIDEMEEDVGLLQQVVRGEEM